MYLYLAILCAIGQIVFIFLLNKTGRKEALEETQDNLSEIFKNLDEESRKEVLLNANLNKDEMILLINNQTQSSAIEIISATVSEFEIIQNDLNKQSENLDEIKKSTLKINEEIIKPNRYLNPNEFIVDLRLLVQIHGRKYDSNYINIVNSDRFRIWISFYQKGIEMHTYLDSKNKWLNINMYESNDVSSVPYAIAFADDMLIINNSKVVLYKTEATSKKRFSSDEPLNFKVHYSGFNSLKLSPINFYLTIKNKDGIVYKPNKTKPTNLIIPNPYYSDLLDTAMPDIKENKLIIMGSFDLRQYN